jgi:hypothetical protein
MELLYLSLLPMPVVSCQLKSRSNAARVKLGVFVQLLRRTFGLWSEEYGEGIYVIAQSVIICTHYQYSMVIKSRAVCMGTSRVALVGSSQ